MPQYNKSDQLKIAESMYPNGTLKNKLGIHNSTRLSHIEFMHSAKEMTGILQQRPKISNVDQLKDINYIMFRGLYSWAGQTRDFDISKNGHNFLPYAVMNNASVYINHLIHIIDTKKEPTNRDYAKLLDTINDLHPFREGNGRSTKCFLECIAINHQQFLVFPSDESEAVQGLDNSNINLIAKNITVQPLIS